MEQPLFIKQLGITALIVAAILLGIHFIPGFSSFWIFSLVSWAGFIALSVLIYKTAYSAAHDANKNKYTNVIIGAVMGKFALSLVIILGYWYGFSPSSKFFLLPFFLIYLGFTIFEVHFLMKLGKTNA